MHTDETTLLQQLLRQQKVAALATLHRGEPAASMVPFALLAECGSALIHVSRLATHCKDMLEHPAVSLLFVAEAQSEHNPLARPRLSLKGRALLCPVDSPRYAAARAAYLERLPEAKELFSFPDFSLFLVEPQSARFVAGFGRAYSLTAERWRAVLAPTASAAGT